MLLMPLILNPWYFFIMHCTVNKMFWYTTHGGFNQLS
jgi:hypothetical protein